MTNNQKEILERNLPLTPQDIIHTSGYSIKDHQTIIKMFESFLNSNNSNTSELFNEVMKYGKGHFTTNQIKLTLDQLLEDSINNKKTNSKKVCLFLFPHKNGSTTPTIEPPISFNYHFFLVFNSSTTPSISSV